MYNRNKSYRELKGSTFKSLIICHLRNEKRAGSEIRPASVCGIVTEAVKSFSINIHTLKKALKIDMKSTRNNAYTFQFEGFLWF